MTSLPLFWAGAATLVALAWAALATAPRFGRGAGPARTAVAVLDAELASLDAAATSSDAQRATVVELQRRLLAESAPSWPVPGDDAPSRRLLATLAVALPVFVLGGYLALGTPAAITAPAAAAPASDEFSVDDLRQMVDTLSRELHARPAGRADDRPGWLMLARSEAALRRFDAAAEAYERALALGPGDAQELADLADVTSVLQAQATDAAQAAARSDRVAQLVDRALALDPRNLKALALAGNAAFARHDRDAAVDLWRRARALAPPGSDFASGLDRSLAEAGAATPAPAAVAGAPGPAAAVRGPLTGTVRLAPGLSGRIGAGDTLFVFARAEHGPRMPLAIVRRPAGTIAEPFTLDDSTAMSPALRLSAFDAVIVGARVSRSGDAMPQSGDLVGEAHVAAGSERVEVVIDRVQP